MQTHMPFMAQSVFPIIKIMQTYLKLFHLTSLQRKAILYLAIMTYLYIAPDKAGYCIFTQFRERENAIKFISVRAKTQ